METYLHVACSVCSWKGNWPMKDDITTRDKINLKWNLIQEEHTIEKCAYLIDDMSQHLGPNSWNSFPQRTH